MYGGANFAMICEPQILKVILQLSNLEIVEMAERYLRYQFINISFDMSQVIHAVKSVNDGQENNMHKVLGFYYQ